MFAHEVMCYQMDAAILMLKTLKDTPAKPVKNLAAVASMNIAYLVAYTLIK